MKEGIMLKPEIEPFADYHISALKLIRTRIITDLEPNVIEVTYDIEMLADWQAMLANAMNALERFKVCMTDEWSQKEMLQHRVQVLKESHS